MKVARQAPYVDSALATLSLLDPLRRGQFRSASFESLLKRENWRLQQEQFFAAVNAADAPKVCEETLSINEPSAIPVDLTLGEGRRLPIKTSQQRD
jgi:hypothetical protein